MKKLPRFALTSSTQKWNIYSMEYHDWFNGCLKLFCSAKGINEAPEEAMLACNCEGKCSDQFECSCLESEGIAYTRNRLLKGDFAGIIVECNDVSHTDFLQIKTQHNTRDAHAIKIAWIERLNDLAVFQSRSSKPQGAGGVCVLLHIFHEVRYASWLVIAERFAQWHRYSAFIPEYSCEFFCVLCVRKLRTSLGRAEKLKRREHKITSSLLMQQRMLLWHLCRYRLICDFRWMHWMQVSESHHSPLFDTNLWQEIGHDS